MDNLNKDDPVAMLKVLKEDVYQTLFDNNHEHINKALSKYSVFDEQFSFTFMSCNMLGMTIATIAIFRNRAIIVMHDMAQKTRTIVPLYSTIEARIEAIDNIYALLSFDELSVSFGHNYKKVFSNTLLWPFLVTIEVPSVPMDDQDRFYLKVHHPNHTYEFAIDYSDLEEVLFAMTYDP